MFNEMVVLGEKLLVWKYGGNDNDSNLWMKQN